MTISRSLFDGCFDVECDDGNCDQTQEVDSDGDFQACVDRIKEDGWKLRKKDGQWQHICPECAGLREAMGDRDD